MSAGGATTTGTTAGTTTSGPAPPAPPAAARGHGLPAAAEVLLSTVAPIRGGGERRSEPDVAGAPARGDRRPGPVVDASRVDWSHLYRLTVRERAAGVLWRRLGGWLEDAAPELWAERFRHLASVSEFRQRRLQRRLVETVAALDTAGVPVLLLKGAALSRTVYADPADRPMYDLDLLVPAGRMAEARRRAEAVGWTRRRDRYPPGRYDGHPHAPPLVDADDPELALELHTDLFIDGHPLDFSARELASAADRIPVGEAGARAPGPVEHLVYVCLHFAWSHAMARGPWRTFRDVGALTAADGFDGDAFVAAARAARAASCCHWTLRLAASLGDVRVPEGMTDALHPPRAGALLRRLERHFALDLFAGGCPSRQIRRAAWSVAVSPRSQGHGRSRPWDRDDAFRTRIPAADGGDDETGSAGRAGAVARGLRYLWAVLGPRAAAPGAP